MVSPNEGKSVEERILSLSRAIMAYSPTGIESSVAISDFFLKNPGFAESEWIHIIPPWEGDWYIRCSDGGQSRKSLPVGATAKYTFDTRGKFPVRTCLQTLAVKAAGMSSASLARAEQTLAASEPGFNESKMSEFRAWLQQTAKSGVQGFPAVTPDHLISFAKDLHRLRSAYQADGMLAGSISAAVDVCMAAGKTNAEHPDKFDYRAFGRLAAYLILGDVLHPVRILSGVIEQSLSNSLASVVKHAADVYRSAAQKRIDAALASKTVDEHLDQLYDAVPFCHAAHIIYARLRDAEYPHANGIYLNVDETLVRITHAFSYQVQDFDGHCWRHHRAAVSAARREKGEGAAQACAEDLVVRHLAYPEILISELMRKN